MYRTASSKHFFCFFEKAANKILNKYYTHSVNFVSKNNF